MSRIEVARSSEVREHEILVAKAGGFALLLTRIAGKVHALENKCPHLGLSMARGKIDGAVIQCPWHGSKFDICSGKNVDWVSAVAGVPMPLWSHKLIALGRRPAPVRIFSVVEDAGRVSVDLS